MGKDSQEKSLDKLKAVAEKYDVPFHMAGDYLTKELNIEAGHELCDRCKGTGNELFSMYRECEACLGTGQANFK